MVLAGTININENSHTTTFECVLVQDAAGIPALSQLGLALLFPLLTGEAMWVLRRAPPA